MKHTLIAAIVLLTATVSAQVPDYPNTCRSCVVYSYVDTPQHGATFSRSSDFIGGWGFLLATGVGTDRVDLSYSYDGESFYTTRQAQHVSLYYHLPRYDVQRVYAPFVAHARRERPDDLPTQAGMTLLGRPEPSPEPEPDPLDHTGFMLLAVPHSQASKLPLGWIYVRVTVWVGPYKTSHTRYVNIVP